VVGFLPLEVKSKIKTGMISGLTLGFMLSFANNIPIC
jgi:hypothetical protein